MYRGKIELHLHLDGSLSADFMRSQLQKQGLDIPRDLLSNIICFFLYSTVLSTLSP